MILISACLCGINCKYNGNNNLDPKLCELVKKGEAIPICPEQLGGLTTPRLPCEIKGGAGFEVLNGKAEVVNIHNENKTQEFIKGAYETLHLAKMAGAELAILKANSPSCGSGTIYDGSFKGKLIKGKGVTAELLSQNQIVIITEEDYHNEV